MSYNIYYVKLDMGKCGRKHYGNTELPSDLPLPITATDLLPLLTYAALATGLGRFSLIYPMT